MIAKFRAWNKNINQMERVIEITFSSEGEITGITTTHGAYWESEKFEAHQLRNLILMQSSGPFYPSHCSHKKQIEVFEDDVCEFIRADNEKQLKDKVLLSHGMFRFSSWAIPLYNEIFKNIKVIGNIHENKDLLHANPGLLEGE